MTNETTRDVLGNERAIARTYADGSWDCPFCSTAVSAARGETVCANPWCVANPAMPLEAARSSYAKQDARDREETARKRNHASAMERIGAERARGAALLVATRAEAELRGACVSCAAHSVSAGRPARYVKHRAACPR